MSAADNFLSLFDEQGRYRNGDGEVGVIFLTQSGTQYPGKLRFKSGLLVSAEMDGASPWGYPDESPLDSLKFLLHFHGEKPRAVFVEQGRVVHNFSQIIPMIRQALEAEGVHRWPYVRLRIATECKTA
jgi:hypothetical protein